MSKNMLRAKMKLGKKLGVGKDKSRKHGILSSSVSVPAAVGAEREREAKTIRKTSLSADSPVHSSKCPSSPHVSVRSQIHRDSTDSPSLTPRRQASGMTVPKVNVGAYDDAYGKQNIFNINITDDVESFLAAVERLKRALEDDTPRPGEENGSESDPVFECLSDLFRVVHNCVSTHVGMQSTELTNAIKTLSNTYKECNHYAASKCVPCNSAMDGLIAAFTNSITQYLTGVEVEFTNRTRSIQSAISSSNLLKGFSKSHDDLLPKSPSATDLTLATVDPSDLSNPTMVDDIDNALSNTTNSVEVAASYLKARLKYHKEMSLYVNKRSQLEAKHLQQVSRLVRNTEIVLAEMQGTEGRDGCYPLVDVFRRAVKNDMTNVSLSSTTFGYQTHDKFTSPMDEKVVECEKLRKELQVTWHKELKKLTEAKTAMKSARNKYHMLGHEISRVKNLLAADPYGKQAEKRKKEVTDLEIRWQEAEASYKSAVAECNVCQYQVHVSSQKSILCAYRRMIMELDHSLKTGLENYYKLQRKFYLGLPDEIQKFSEDVQEYEVGKEFYRFIRHQPTNESEPEDYYFEEFDPEMEAEIEESSGTDSIIAPMSSEPDAVIPTRRNAERSASPMSLPQAWERTSTGTDVPRGTASNSPRGSWRNKPRPRSIASILEGSGLSDSTSLSRFSEAFRRNSDHQEFTTSASVSPPSSLHHHHQEESPLKLSRMALTHSFKKLHTPSRCRECSNYVYFNGVECQTCGLACHKKCQEILAIKCGSRKLARKMTTFGIDISKHLKATRRYIPIIVTKCINELDERGLNTQGVYRISSSKSKLERLCQLFESGADRLDLSDRPPNLIGSCLKLYLRQLPEPLMTFGLYHDFIQIGRESSVYLPCDLRRLPEEKLEMPIKYLDILKGLLEKLPYENYATLARLLFHLKRVSTPEHTKYNCMPASNLGIVFGPNLLRQREIVASLSLLADMTVQAKVIEILIYHVHEVFNPTEEELIRVVEGDAETETTHERLVDEQVTSPIEARSPIPSEFDDISQGTRSPYCTPPEKRRQNVNEMGNLMGLLESGKPSYARSSHLEVPSARARSYTQSNTQLPGAATDESTDAATCPIGRPLKAFEKVLTPVQEKLSELETEENVLHVGDNDEDISDEEESILRTDSPTGMDERGISRSTSGLSSYDTLACDMEESELNFNDVEEYVNSAFRNRTDSNASSHSFNNILSGGLNSPQLLLLGSQSLESMEDVGQTSLGKDEEESMGAREDEYPDRVKALFMKQNSPTSPRGNMFHVNDSVFKRSLSHVKRRRPSSDSHSSGSSSLVSPRHVVKKNIISGRNSADSSKPSILAPRLSEDVLSLSALSATGKLLENMGRSESLDESAIGLTQRQSSSDKWKGSREWTSYKENPHLSSDNQSEAARRPVKAFVATKGDQSSYDKEGSTSPKEDELKERSCSPENVEEASGSSLQRMRSSKDEHKTDSGNVSLDGTAMFDVNEEIPLPDDSKPSVRLKMFASHESGLADSPELTQELPASAKPSWMTPSTAEAAMCDRDSQAQTRKDSTEPAERKQTNSNNNLVEDNGHDSQPGGIDLEDNPLEEKGETVDDGDNTGLCDKESVCSDDDNPGVENGKITTASDTEVEHDNPKEEVSEPREPTREEEQDGSKDEVDHGVPSSRAQPPLRVLKIIPTPSMGQDAAAAAATPMRPEDDEDKNIEDAPSIVEIQVMRMRMASPDGIDGTHTRKRLQTSRSEQSLFSIGETDDNDEVLFVPQKKPLTIQVQSTRSSKRRIRHRSSPISPTVLLNVDSAPTPEFTLLERSRNNTPLPPPPPTSFATTNNNTRSERPSKYSPKSKRHNRTPLFV